ncbi:MAG: SPOR domain-containing protein, partial [Deltaproteobacteria bacterium]|nr:SPOR domain-containing protein [Deltaproteobacteria bacterium]
VNQSGEKYYRVRIGSYREIEQAKSMKTKLLEKDGFEGMVISLK